MAPTLAETALAIPGYSATDLSLERAQTFVNACVPCVGGEESLELLDACGRILAEGLLSPFDLPPDDLSAMDGYAVCSRTAQALELLPVPVVGSSLAGHPWKGPVDERTCLRITTGAIVPPGLDCVVPQELIRSVGSSIVLPSHGIQAGANVRRQGEDLCAGDTAIPAGTELNASHIGLAASLGLARLTVRRRLKVVYFSTGDELRTPGAQSPAGSGIYDSNRYTLGALLRRLPFLEVHDGGKVPDAPERLQQTLQHACERADVVLTTGGVSHGSADHTRTAMGACAEMVFWQLAVKPGRPFAFGRAPRGSVLFGLPGNPVAMVALFCALVRPALQRMAGMGEPSSALPYSVRATCSHDHPKKPGRTEFLRGSARVDGAGQWSVEIDRQQSSGNLAGLSRSNALVVLGQDQGFVSAGNSVTVWPLHGLL